MKHPKFRLTGAVVALLALLVWSPAHAAPITESLGVEVVFGPATGETGTIEVSYDDLDISGSGNEILDSSQFTLELMLFGQTFTEANDIDFPGFPELGFTDGVIVSIDFIINETSPLNPTAIADPRVVGIFGFTVDNGVWPVSTQGLPVPPTPGLFLAGLLAWMAARHRRVAAGDALIPPVRF